MSDLEQKLELLGNAQGSIKALENTSQAESSLVKLGDTATDTSKKTRGLIDDLSDLSKGFLELVGELDKTLELSDFISFSFGSISDDAKGLIGFLDDVSGGFQKIKGFAKSSTDGLFDGLIGSLDDARNKLSGFLNKVTGGFKTIKGFTKGLFNGLSLGNARKKFSSYLSKVTGGFKTIKGFTKGLFSKIDLGEASKKFSSFLSKVTGGFKTIKGFTKTLFSGLGSAAGKLFSPLLGGLDKVLGISGLVSKALDNINVATLMSNSISAAKEVRQLSQQLNISAEDLTSWQFAASKVNIDGDKMADIFKKVNENVGNYARTGAGPLADIMEQTNLNINELVNLSPDQQLRKIYDEIDNIQGISDSGKSFFLKSLTGDAGSLIPLLENGGSKLDEFVQRAHDLDIVMTDLDVEKLHIATDSLDDLNPMIQGAANHFTVAMAPAIDTVMKHIDSMAVAHGGWGKVATDVASSVINGFGYIMKAVYSAQIAIAGIEKGWKEAVHAKRYFTTFGKFKGENLRLYNQEATEIDGLSDKIRELTMKKDQLTTFDGEFVLVKRLEKVKKELEAKAQATLDARNANNFLANSNNELAGTFPWLKSLNTENNGAIKEGTNLMGLRGKALQDYIKKTKEDEKSTNKNTEGKKGAIATTKKLTKTEKDNEKQKQDAINSKKALTQGYNSEIAALERELFALDANVVELAKYDAQHKKHGENNLKYSSTQIKKIVNLTKEREERKKLKEEEQKAEKAREGALTLLNDELKKRDELKAKLTGGAVAVTKLSDEYKKLKDDEQESYLVALKDNELSEKRIKQKETYQQMLEDTARAIELEIIAQTQGIDAARERELFYETGSKERAKEILDNEKIYDGLKKRKELWQELKSAISGAYDKILSNVAATGDLSNALNGVVEGLIDAGKQSQDPYIQAASYAFEFAGALFSDFLSEAEIKAAAGRTDFEDESLTNLLTLTEKTQYPMLELTKRMSGYLYSMDNKFGIVAKSLGSSTGIDVSGSDYVASTSSSLGGIKSRTVELVGAGIEIYIQSIGDALDNGVDAIKFETEKLTKTKLGRTKQYLRTSYEELGSDAIRALTEGLDAGVQLIIDSGKLFGFDLESQLLDYEIEIGKINFIGLSDEQIQARLNQVFSEIFSGAIDSISIGHYVDELGNIRSKTLSDYIDRYSQVGEESLETLGRIAVEFEQASYAIALTGKNIETVNFDALTSIVIQGTELVTGGLKTQVGGVVGLLQDASQELNDIMESSEDPALFQNTLDSLKSTGRTVQEIVLDIVQASGGLESFNTNMSAFVTNFYDETERFNMQQQYMVDSFNELGIALPETNKEFRDLVNSIPVTTEEGAKLYAELLGLSQAFADLEAAEAALEGGTKSLTISLKDAQQLFDSEILGVNTSLRDATETVKELGFVDTHDIRDKFRDLIAGMTPGTEDYNNAIRYSEAVDIIADAQDTAAQSLSETQQIFDSEILGINTSLRDATETVKELGFVDTNNIRQKFRNLIEGLTPGTDKYNNAIKYAEAVDTVADAHEETAEKVEAAYDTIKQLTSELFKLFEDLDAIDLEIANGPTISQSEIINTQIEGQREIIAGIKDQISAEKSRISEINQAQKSAYQEAIRYWETQQSSAERGREYLESLLLDTSLTTLTPAEQLAEAQEKYNAALSSNDAGDAQNALQGLLTIARDAYGSTDAYDAILDSSTSSFSALLDYIESQPEPQDPRDIASVLLPQLEAQQVTAEAQLDALQNQLELAQEEERVTSLEEEREQLAIQIREKLSELDLALNNTLLNELPDDIRSQLNSDLEAIRAATDNAQLQAAMETTRDHVNALPVDIKGQLDPNLVKLLDINASLESDDGSGDNVPAKLGRIATRLWSDSDSLGAGALLGFIRSNLKQQNANWDVSGQNAITSYAVGSKRIMSDHTAVVHKDERYLTAGQNDDITPLLEDYNNGKLFSPVIIPTNLRDNEKQLEKTNQILIDNNKKLEEKFDKLTDEVEALRTERGQDANKAFNQRKDQIDAVKEGHDIDRTNSKFADSQRLAS